MRLDSSFESLAGFASVRSGSVADLADDTPRRPLHRHSYAAPAHNDPEIVTPTKPFGLGKLKKLWYNTPYFQIRLNSSSLTVITHCHGYYKLRYILHYAYIVQVRDKSNLENIF